MIEKDPRERETRVPSVDGIVRESLPYALYRVEIDGPRQVTARVPSGPGKNFVRVLVGDRVRLELEPAGRRRADG